MKILIPIALTVLLAGCTYNYPYSRSSIGACGQHVPDLPGSQYSMVNNCGYRLDVYQDGKYLGVAEPGQVLPIKGPLLWRKTAVTVTGYDAEGSYVGSASWIYEFGIPEVWTVHSLNKPRRPQ